MTCSDLCVSSSWRSADVCLNCGALLGEFLYFFLQLGGWVQRQERPCGFATPGYKSRSRLYKLRLLLIYQWIVETREKPFLASFLYPFWVRIGLFAVSSLFSDVSDLSRSIIDWLSPAQSSSGSTLASFGLSEPFKDLFRFKGRISMILTSLAQVILSVWGFNRRYWFDPYLINVYLLAFWSSFRRIASFL
jgi:hypothetical protein